MVSRINYSSILIITVLIALSLLFNQTVINIRLQEANYYLYNDALNKFALNTFIISSKYELIKKQIEKGESHNHNYKLEGQMQLILSEEQASQPEFKYTPPPYYHPVSIILRTLRMILGKKQLSLPKDYSTISKELEISFFLERNRNYQKAIDIYNKLLAEGNLTDQQTSFVLLHKAFCLSMLGQFIESASIYETINMKYPDTEAGILSAKLKVFIHGIIEKNRRLAESRETDLYKGHQMFLNMNYKKALTYLQKEIESGKPENRSEAHYFKGRTYEELGQYRKAVYEYHKIMSSGDKNKWSKGANRRLLMLSNFYNQEHPLMSSAEKNLESLKDTTFLNSVSKLKDLINVSKEKDSLNSQLLDEPLSVNDSIINSLSKSATINENDILAANRSKVLSKEEKIALKRKLANNKYRKASFIRKTINKNTPKIQKLYLEYASSGKKISGNITVEMEIQASGKIDVSILNSDIKYSKFNRAVVREIGRWRFPEIDKELGSMKVSYPFNFKD